MAHLLHLTCFNILLSLKCIYCAFSLFSLFQCCYDIHTVEYSPKSGETLRMSHFQAVEEVLLLSDKINTELCLELNCGAKDEEYYDYQ